MEYNDESAPIVDDRKDLHRNNLYICTLDGDEILGQHCCFADLNLTNLELHFYETETAYCIKKLVELSTKEAVTVGLTLYGVTGKPSETLAFIGKITGLKSTFSWDNVAELTKWVVHVTPTK